jgi:MoxR-like ATPase
MDSEPILKIIENISKIILGKREALELLIVALIADGHVLLEDVPGVGKTLLAKSLARSINGTFKRVQFTPDLLPSDITGFNIYDQLNSQFKYQSGPVHTNILLADEINRAIPRTQSSLLESMEERQVSIDGETMKLPKPFLVIATQNSIEMEGTFPLPEAQLDRFLLKIKLGYPDRESEMMMLKNFQYGNPLEALIPVIELDQLAAMQENAESIIVSDACRGYIISIVAATRNHPNLEFGASPRGSLSLMRASRGYAAVKNRNYVQPDDIKAVLIPVLSHRVILTESAKLSDASSQQILNSIANEVPVPT